MSLTKTMRTHIFVGTIVVCLPLLTGCFTSAQVKKVVDESNQQTIALLTTSNGVSAADDAERAQAGDWVETANRLQAVINQNQENDAVADPMRLRLAYLLLTAEKPNL
ncbi:MAG: hypothetical protein AAGI11_22435, partial [Pseudomonadota bacterium]